MSDRSDFYYINGIHCRVYRKSEDALECLGLFRYAGESARTNMYTVFGNLVWNVLYRMQNKYKNKKTFYTKLRINKR